MTIYVQKIPTYESNVWDGTNTVAFQEWAEPFLPAIPEGYSRAWDLIDNQNDPENTITDGILRARVPGQSMSFYTSFFVLNENMLAGPLFDGNPSAFGETGLNARTTVQIEEQFTEVV